jgi:hypothetical protein
VDVLTVVAEVLNDRKMHYDFVPNLPTNLLSRPSQGILDQMEEALFFPAHKPQDNIQARLALVGPEQAGLSLLASCFVHEMLNSPDDYHIFWVDASTSKRVEESYIWIATRLGNLLKNTSSTDLLHFLSWQLEGHWLVVFENLQHQTALYLASQHRLPQGLNGSLLFMTKEKSCLRILQPLEKLDVPESEWLQIIEQDYKPKRPYTSSLGVPADYSLAPRSIVEFISDAGEQQFLRRHHALTQVSSGSHMVTNVEQFSSLLELGKFHTLQEHILDALEQGKSTQGVNNEFLPVGELCRLINPRSVAQELTKDLDHIYTRDQISQYAEVVCGETEVMHRGKVKIRTFRKVFALLVIVETTSSLPLFIEEDVSDLDLPLISIQDQGSSRLCRRDISGEPSPIPLACFQQPVWSPVKLRNFQEYQWKLLAPFFSRGNDGDIKHYALQDQHILPFLPLENEEEDNAQRTGGFGKVLMVRIHEDHHNFGDKNLSDRGFAIKQQLYHNDRITFEKEIAILKRFSGDRSHPHLASLLATFEHNGKFHLAFHRAECDLYAFWKKRRPRPIVDLVNIEWFAKQCAGLADGLSKLERILNGQTDAVERKESGERLKIGGNEEEERYEELGNLRELNEPKPISHAIGMCNSICAVLL